MFSKELELSIASLFDRAHEANIQYITVEHLLLMITNDFDVKEFFKSLSVNIDNLKDDLNTHLSKNVVSKIDQQKPVQPTLGFQRVLQRAVFHIQSSGKGVVKPINILVAIFSEKESHSVFLLNKYKLSRLDVVTYLSHGPKESEDTKTLNENVNKDDEIIDATSAISIGQEKISFTPALYKIFDEILANAADNVQRDSKMTKIHVDIDENTGEISIFNDGASIPVRMHEKEKMYIPELVLGNLMTGSNFDDNVGRLTGGRHGFGAKLTNIFSKRFEIECADPKEGLLYNQVWENNMQQKSVPHIEPYNSKP